MSRELFGPDACGPAIEAIQNALGFEQADGVYGRKTVAGVTAFQRKAGLTPSGMTDDETWLALVRRPIPELFERIISLTAAFEGHGFALAQGNFDGAGITWGIIGFTLAAGSLRQVIERIEELDAAALDSAFGPLRGTLTEKLSLPLDEQLAWAQQITLGVGLAAPWRAAFRRLGELPVARQAQMELARRAYFDPALAVARGLGFGDELGVALCFDIQVQSGGLREGVRRQVAAVAGSARERRELLARLAAGGASGRWQADVLARKLAIATGVGRVHGKNYYLANWGLGEYPAGPVLDQVGPKSG